MTKRPTVDGLRAALGWSQARLAAESGVRQQRISDIESGRTVRVAHRDAQCLARAFRAAGLDWVTAETLFPVDCKRS